MKTAMVAAALLLLLLPGSALADVLYPDALVFGPSYAIGPPAGFPWVDLPDVGDPLTIIGKVATINAPFADLLPAGAHEVTFVIAGTTCTETGNWDDFSGCPNGGMYAAFQSGTLSVYLDVTPDADFALPATFSDGEPVLNAAITIIHITDDDPYEVCPMLPDNADAGVEMTPTGGAWFSRVSSGGVGFRASGEGEVNRFDVVPAALQALGYSVRIDGAFDFIGPVAVEPTTWGKVKALYRN